MRNNVCAVASAYEHIVYTGLVSQGSEPHPYAGLNRFAKNAVFKKRGVCPVFILFFSASSEPPMGNPDCAPDMNH